MKKTVTPILAISGGPDSVYLLHQLLEKGKKPILAHLNHQLRGADSDLDEQFIKDLADKHGLLCEIEHANIKTYSQTHKQSLETAGRTLRYEFLERTRLKHRADRIYLAHNLNDNLETVLMNEQRGCNLRGRIGMVEKNGALVRPLLNTSKSEILAWLHARSLPYRIDATNVDTRFRRNHIRHNVIPKLLAENPNLLQDFQAERTQAIQDYKHLTDWAQNWFQENPNCPRNNFLSLPETQQQFLLQYQYAHHHGSTFNLTTPQLREVQKMILRGHGNKQRILGKNLLIRLEQGKILFTKPLKQNTLSAPH